MSTQAAIIKCHRLVGLSNRQLFLTVREAGKSKVKVLAESVSWLADGCLLAVSSHGGEQGHLSLYGSMVPAISKFFTPVLSIS